MLNILHLSYDLRHRMGYEVTTAVKKLIQATTQFSHPMIVDLVRVPRFSEESADFIRPNHLTLNSMGLPKGFFLMQSLKRACRTIKRAMSDSGISLSSINLIHAHKLTFEGYIGSMLAKEMNLPLVVTLRQSDFRIFKYRPDLDGIYKRIIMQSCVIFYLVPNMLVFIKNKFGEKFYHQHIAEKVVFLPNIVERPPCQIKYESNKNELITIARMTKKSVKRKNLKKLFKAVKALSGEGIKLKVIGDGHYLKRLKLFADSIGTGGNIMFCGAVDHKLVDQYYVQAQAFVMPSYSESFGMCYAEALLNGTPILYSRGVLSFEGMFENVGVGVDPHSVDDIINGIMDITMNSNRYRKTIKNYHHSKAFEVFSTKSIAATYHKSITGISIDSLGT